MVSEGHGTYSFADKVNREGHLEEGFHLTRVEIQLLQRDNNAM